MAGLVGRSETASGEGQQRLLIFCERGIEEVHEFGTFITVDAGFPLLTFCYTTMASLGVFNPKALASTLRRESSIYLCAHVRRELR